MNLFNKKTKKSEIRNQDKKKRSTKSYPTGIRVDYSVNYFMRMSN